MPGHVVRLRERAPVLLSLVASNFLAECGELFKLVGSVHHFFSFFQHLQKAKLCAGFELGLFVPAEP